MSKRRCSNYDKHNMLKILRVDGISPNTTSELKPIVRILDASGVFLHP